MLCFSAAATIAIPQGHSLAWNQSSLTPAPADSGLSATFHWVFWPYFLTRFGMHKIVIHQLIQSLSDLWAMPCIA